MSSKAANKRILIADDVGLGKTIETGLVAQELTLRHRVRSILVVCPSSIQRQWQEEMRDKFGMWPVTAARCPWLTLKR